jgi:uncharacterized integral membrane protein (TIGR00698 family)
MASTSTHPGLQPERAEAAVPAETSARQPALTPRAAGGAPGLAASARPGLGLTGPHPAAPGPNAMSPGAVSPEAVTPGAVSPGAVSPEAVTPGAVSPGAVTPGGVGAAALPGLLAALAVGIVATLIGQNVPLVGTAVPGALIGVLVALTLTWAAARRHAGAGSGAASRLDVEGLRKRLNPGLRLASSRLLQCSVVILGAQLSLSTAVRVGLSSLPVMLGTLAVCLGATFLYGRLLGIVGDLRTLIGVGTGICGASAIAAVSPVIEASSTDIAYAVSTIFLFNITAVLVFPVVGHALGMTQHAFGLFAGTAVNDTSSVVATATTYGSSAASYAVVVKLVRTLMIIPICMGLSAVTARKKAAGPGAVAPAGRAPARRFLKLVPWFLIGFVIMAAANSAGVIPSGWHGTLSEASVFLVAVALSAIGLSTDVAALRRAGVKPVLLGAMLWVTVGSASLGLQFLTGTLH